jgi:hypothetical protein
LFNQFLFSIIRDVLNLYAGNFYISSIQTLNEQIRVVLIALLKIAKINEQTAFDVVSLGEYIDLDIENNKADYDEGYSEHLVDLKRE